MFPFFPSVCIFRFPLLGVEVFHLVSRLFLSHPIIPHHHPPPVHQLSADMPHISVGVRLQGRGLERAIWSNELTLSLLSVMFVYFLVLFSLCFPVCVGEWLGKVLLDLY